MKGILLAGGYGTRLFPLTKCISKQLLPVYDKPLIYYPLSILMLAHIREILIISTRSDIVNIQRLFGSGEDLGLSISYAIQHEPRGIAEAFIIGERFINNDPVCLILGDNILYGNDFAKRINQIVPNVRRTAYIFAYQVKNPQNFGIVSFDKEGYPLSIEEKPERPASNWAVIGLYLYPSDVVEFARELKPSWRNELEITDINRMYLKQSRLNVIKLGRGFAWLDAGTPENLSKATQFVQIIEEMNQFKIACLEEIALANNFITKEKVIDIANKNKNSSYGNYLLRLVDDH